MLLAASAAPIQESVLPISVVDQLDFSRLQLPDRSAEACVKHAQRKREHGTRTRQNNETGLQGEIIGG